MLNNQEEKISNGLNKIKSNKGRRFKERTLKVIDSLENYLSNPSRYNTRSVIVYIYETDCVETISAILEEDKRKSVQFNAKTRLGTLNSRIDPTMALTRFRNGSINKDQLKHHLKGDEKYIDYIIKRYKESCDRNRKLPKGNNPEISPSIRLFNIPWVGKLKTNESMFVSPNINHIIERGYTK